jgi:hypothetical protein
MRCLGRGLAPRFQQEINATSYYLYSTDLSAGLESADNGQKKEEIDFGVPISSGSAAQS